MNLNGDMVLYTESNIDVKLITEIFKENISTNLVVRKTTNDMGTINLFVDDMNLKFSYLYCYDVVPGEDEEKKVLALCINAHIGNVEFAAYKYMSKIANILGGTLELSDSDKDKEKFELEYEKFNRCNLDKYKKMVQETNKKEFMSRIKKLSDKLNIKLSDLTDMELSLLS